MTRRTLWLVSVVLGLSVLHHVTPESWNAAHETLKRAFYVPVLFAAVRGGPVLAIVVAAVATIVYIPHFAWATHSWIAPRAPHVADLMLLPVVGLVTAVFTQRMSRLRTTNERAVSELARKHSLVERFIDAEVDADRHVILGRVTAGLLPTLTCSGNAACEAVLAARGAGRTSNQRDYELGVALREISNVMGAVDACRTLVSPQRSDGGTDTADTARLAAQLARGELEQRSGSIVLDEPLRPMRVTIARDLLLRVLIGVALDASYPGARVHLRTRPAGRSAALEVRIVGNHVAPEAFHEPLASSETPAVLPALRSLVHRSGGMLAVRTDDGTLVCEIRVPLAETTPL